MKVYLVGGALRDSLLGLVSSDHDYVVVGASEEELLSIGYKRVGQGFPVFLNPVTNDEYALARKEVKSGIGYKGFTFDFSPDITLEEDLLRRDLTINAIAQNIESSDIIDPFNGREDLKNKLLRHVSDHFIEDPLRVIRLARFQAKFNTFTICEETNDLAVNLAKTNELASLSPQRIWKEVEKVMLIEHASLFFKCLGRFGADESAMPQMYFSLKSISDKSYALIDSSYDIFNNLSYRFGFILYVLKDHTNLASFSRQAFPKLCFKFLDSLLNLHVLFEKLMTSSRFDSLSSEEVLTLYNEFGAFKDKDYTDNLYSAIRLVCDVDFLSDLKRLHSQLITLPYAEIVSASSDKKLAVREAKLEVIEAFLAADICE